MGYLVCERCERTYDLAEAVWRCECGGLLDLCWQPSLDGITRARQGARSFTLWRYRPALPITEDAGIVSLGEPITPLQQIDLGMPVWVKQDQLFATGSYKDRGAAVLISVAHGLGVHRVVEDSSGNAGSAIAAYCAQAGIECSIYVPEATSPAKLAQIVAYGARLVRVPGSREDTARAAMDAAENVYYASHSWNPFFFQGTKTYAYEVCEQLGWRAPDTVVLPVGNGTLLLGAALGFRELAEAGIIERVPRLVAVQAAGCAPLYEAFQAGEDEPRLPIGASGAHPLAEGIAIAAPVRGRQILRVVRETGGTFLAVDDDETMAAWRRMAGLGYYIEPTSAATIAGCERYVAALDHDELIVSVFTGHGLKAAGKLPA